MRNGLFIFKISLYSSNKKYALFNQTCRKKDVTAIFHFICALEETVFDFAAFDNIYNSNIHQAGYHYLVAVTEKNTTAGFISCHTQLLLHHCGPVAEIQELYVDEKYRGMGIGHHLIKTLEQHLLQDACNTVEVTAQHKRIATHRFYESLAFHCTHKKFVKQLG